MSSTEQMDRDVILKGIHLSLSLSHMPFFFKHLHLAAAVSHRQSRQNGILWKNYFVNAQRRPRLTRPAKKKKKLMKPHRPSQRLDEAKRPETETFSILKKKNHQRNHQAGGGEGKGEMQSREQKERGQ